MVCLLWPCLKSEALMNKWAPTIISRRPTAPIMMSSVAMPTMTTVNTATRARITDHRGGIPRVLAGRTVLQCPVQIRVSDSQLLFEHFQAFAFFV